MAIAKGAAAVAGLSENEGGQSAEFTALKSGSTFKVAVKGTEDMAQYYNYGVFKQVNSFTPKTPAERNAKGFITGNPSPWDQAAQYYFDKANEATDKAEEDELKAEARKYKGKPKFIMGFHDLTSGTDIVVDLTKNQAMTVYQAILEYEDDLEDMAFKLSKQGESTSTTVTLNPIVNLTKGLSDKERENFEAAKGKPFNDELFDGVLYEMDEAEQIEALERTGFDVSLIGITAQKSAEGANESSATQPAEPAEAAAEADPTESF
ncbi:hypothetical protein D7Z54_34640 [Salibacterium salarium]|uniref:Uncharacterized protein n=1 Tax=Salibacterium salarium TaxID=284579 RepID=A0A3R9R7D2_9BACI|nr:hypothetical protein [Salibacterium salarium]RSL28786.1 hypothetical protein D7Z54_34640 [Salibacterium salarium]